MTPRMVILFKLIVAAAAVVAVVAIPAREIAPDLSLSRLIIYLAGAFAGLVLLAICSLQFAQFILRRGGTDAQWFWFNREPPGLEQQRAKSKAGHES